MTPSVVSEHAHTHTKTYTQCVRCMAVSTDGKYTDKRSSRLGCLSLLWPLWIRSRQLSWRCQCIKLLLRFDFQWLWRKNSFWNPKSTLRGFLGDRLCPFWERLDKVNITHVCQLNLFQVERAAVDGYTHALSTVLKSGLWAKVRQKTQTVAFYFEEIGPDGQL